MANKKTVLRVFNRKIKFAGYLRGVTDSRDLVLTRSYDEALDFTYSKDLFNFALELFANESKDFTIYVENGTLSGLPTYRLVDRYLDYLDTGFWLSYDLKVRLRDTKPVTEIRSILGYLFDAYVVRLQNNIVYNDGGFLALYGDLSGRFAVACKINGGVCLLLSGYHVKGCGVDNIAVREQLKDAVKNAWHFRPSNISGDIDISYVAEVALKGLDNNNGSVKIGEPFVVPKGLVSKYVWFKEDLRSGVDFDGLEFVPVMVRI